MVFPAIETRALPGNLEDAYLAGITPRMLSGTIEYSTPDEGAGTLRDSGLMETPAKSSLVRTLSAALHWKINLFTRTMNPNQALWEKGDFTRIAAFMRESGEAVVKSLGVTKPLRV